MPKNKDTPESAPLASAPAAPAAASAVASSEPQLGDELTLAPFEGQLMIDGQGHQIAPEGRLMRITAFELRCLQRSDLRIV